MQISFFFALYKLLDPGNGEKNRGLGGFSLDRLFTTEYLRYRA